MEQELVATNSASQIDEEPCGMLYDYQEAPPINANPNVVPIVSNQQSRWRQTQTPIAIIIVLCGLWLFVYNSSASLSGRQWVEEPFPSQNDNFVEGPGQNDHLNCAQVCQAHRESRWERNGGDLLNTRDMLRLAATAKAKMIAQLQMNYGKTYFSKIFEQEGGTSSSTSSSNKDEAKKNFLANLVGLGREKMPTTPKIPPYRGVEEAYPDGKSMQRFKLKLHLKLLAVQAAIRKEEKNIHGCDCTDGDILINGGGGKGGTPSNPTTKDETKDYVDPFYYSRFVWASGGDSNTAGHGNLLNETYTAYMERAVKDVFASVGIEFEGRNGGMGGVSSGYEVSMCSEAIFGNDIDVLSWDYALTDGGTANRLLHYGYRAGLNPGRPALVGLNLDGRPSETRLTRLQELEAMGLAVFWSSVDVEAKMKDAVPDMEALTEEQIQAIPPWVRNFKCSTGLERGVPHCSDEKYNLAVCPHRDGMTSWHPGWKSHALEGNKLALFLVEVLLEALNDLTFHKDYPAPEERIKSVRTEEDMIFREYKGLPLPNSSIDDFEADTNSDLDIELLFRGPNVCHTARLPAQTRYIGILTDTDKVGLPTTVGDETYDVGIPRIQADESDPHGILRLVHEPNERHSCPTVPLKIDYMDYFYTRGGDGWTKIILPNDAEREAYQYDTTKFKGLIVVYFSDCYWEKCEQGDLHGDNFDEGNYEIQVNGDTVTGWEHIGAKTNKASGYVMKGNGGIYWKPNNNGVFEVKVRVLDSKSFIRFSSFVLY